MTTKSSSKRNWLLSCPTRGQIQWATVTRLEQIRDRYPGMEPIRWQPGNLSVAQTRNRIVKYFMYEGDWRWLIMVDDDIVPPQNLLEDFKKYEGYDVIAVPHPMPNPLNPGQLVFTAYESDDDKYTNTELSPGMNECDAIATGCVMIHRRVFNELGDSPFRIEDDPTATITSDDFLFCKDVKAAGFSIGAYWDWNYYCDHHTVTMLAPLIEAKLMSTGGRL